MAPHSPSAASSSSQERAQDAAEVDLQVTTRKQKLFEKWQNFPKEFSFLVCAASVALTLIVVAALGIHGFIECPKQISELADYLMTTDSSLANVLIGCSEEREDLQQQLRDATSNLTAAVNEMKDVRKIVGEYGKVTGDLKERLGLIQDLNTTTDNFTSLVQEAVRDLAEVHSSLATVETEVTQLNLESLRLKEAADDCACRLSGIKQSKEENPKNPQAELRNITPLSTESTPPGTEEQNLEADASDCCTLKTEIDKLRGENQDLGTVADNVPNLESEMDLCAKRKKDFQEMIFNQKFSFIWNYCDRKTLKCAHCMPDWVEHSSRCFLFSPDEKSWPDARAQCIRLGGDLAVVSSDQDQEFLTNLVKNAAVVGSIRAAWIGLSDTITEDEFIWINMQDVGETHWRENEPNNHIPSWDEKKIGQDCVTIEDAADWKNSWDDVICTGRRHYICETAALLDLPTAPAA